MEYMIGTDTQIDKSDNIQKQYSEILLIIQNHLNLIYSH